MDITHEDYDWLGVLDSLDVEHAALEAAATAAAAGPPGGAGAPWQYPPAVSATATTAATTTTTAATTAPDATVGSWHCPPAAADPVSVQAGHFNIPNNTSPEGASSGGESGRDDDHASVDTAAPAGYAPPAPAGEKFEPVAGAKREAPDDASEEGGTGDKALVRIYRKRSREKQRRVDTNVQFAALADLVREIETTDLAEEARFRALEELRVGDTRGGDALLSALKPRTSIPAFNPSNRVDLISRTIAQLSQFRGLRRRRTEEVRDAKRQCCELRKECERLQRTVAHYKMTGGGGPPKPPEQVMMMVPMMVPQDAVGQIAGGYPAAHQYAAAHRYAAPGAPTYAAAAQPWATMMAHHAAPPRQPQQLAPAPMMAPAPAPTGLQGGGGIPMAAPPMAAPPMAAPPMPPQATAPAPMMALAPAPAALPEPAKHAAPPGVASMMPPYPAQAPAPHQGGGGNLAHCA